MQKTVKLRCLIQRVAHPDEMPVKPDESSEHGLAMERNS